MTNDTADVCRKMVDAMRKAKGDQFALGYMESFLVCIIDKYVTDEKQLATLKIGMLEVTCEYAIQKIEAE